MISQENNSSKISVNEEVLNQASIFNIHKGIFN